MLLTTNEIQNLALFIAAHGVDAEVVAGPRGQRMVAVTTHVYAITGGPLDNRAEYAGTETTLVGTVRDALDLLGY